MPSQCFGVLRCATASAGNARRQARKKYDDLCPTCWHHTHGSRLQEHRPKGSLHRCKNWPSCSRQLQRGCDGFCIQCFKASGGEPKVRRKPAVALPRRPPTTGGHLFKAPTKRKIASSDCQNMLRKRLRTKTSDSSMLSKTHSCVHSSASLADSSSVISQLTEGSSCTAVASTVLPMTSHSAIGGNGRHEYNS